MNEERNHRNEQQPKQDIQQEKPIKSKNKAAGLKSTLLANMISFIQGNCHPECCHTNRGSHGLATNRKKKRSENILNTTLFT